AKREEPAEARHPLTHYGHVLLQNRPRARVQLLAIVAPHRNARHCVRDFVGTDGQIIVLRPALRDHFFRTDDPPDTRPGNAVRLRKPAGHDHTVAHAPEARGPLAVDLRTLVDFVR